MQRARKWMARAGAGLLIVLAMAVGFLMTAPGQRLALGIGGGLASDADTRVEIGRLDGSLFGTGRIDRIIVHDGAGAWLDVRDLQFAWHPAQLFTGRIAIDQLVVGSIHVLRQPSGGSTSPGGESGAPTLVPVTAKHVEVREVILDPSVAGRPVRLHVTASADLADPRSGLAASIAVTRLDEPGAGLQADFAYRAQTDMVELRIEGREPAGGLVAELLDFPERPPLAITFSGSGPRDRWRADWALSAAEQPFAAGTAAVDRAGQGHRLEARFEGYLAQVVPAALAGVLDGKTVGVMTGSWSKQDRFDVEQLSLSSAAMQLSLTGALDRARSYVHGRAALRVKREDGAPVPVPLGADEALAVHSLALDLTLPDAPSQRTVRAELQVNGIAGAFGSIGSVGLSAMAAQSQPWGETARDAHKIEATGQVDGLALHDATLGEAVGQTAQLGLAGHADAGTLTLSELRAEIAGSTLVASGEISDGRFDGTAEVQAGDLSRFAAVASLPMSGAIALRAKGSVGLADAAFDLDVAASGRDVKPGIDVADRLLAGTPKLTGRIARTADGEIEVDEVALTTQTAQATVTARAGASAVELEAGVQLRDLSKLADALAGSSALTIEVSGTRDDAVSQITLTGANVQLRGAKLNAPEVTFSGRGPLNAHAGRLAVSGDLDGQPIAGAAAIAFSEADGVVLDSVSLRVASAQLSGGARLPSAGNPQGRFTLSLPRMADLAPFAGVSLQGSAEAAIELSEASGVAVAAVRAQVPALQVAKMQLKGLTVHARAVDYMGALKIDGTARLALLSDAGLKVRDVRLDAKPAAAGTAFEAAGVVNDFRAALRGTAARKDALLAVTLASASLRNDAVAAVIDQPATIALDNGAARIAGLVIKTGEGRTKVGGTIAADGFDVAVAIKSLPAGLANAFDSTLGLEGRIDGTIAIKGTPAVPKAEAVLAWSGASAQVLRAQSLPALQVDARAQLAGDVVSGKVDVGGAGGLSLQATGRAGTAARSPITARIAGSIPLTLANGVLGERAASASGTAQLTAEISGVASDPQVAGSIRIEGAGLNDPASGLKLVGIAGNARFTQTGVTIERLGGASARGGTFTSSGSVTLGANGAMTTNLALDVSGLKFDDQQLMSGELDANLAVSGPLDGLYARGAIGLKRLDVIVPSQMPQSITSLDIKHVNAPANSRAARESAAAEAQTTPPVSARLDIRLDAANRIFVKGRGLDAQLGGALHVQGTTEAPIANGAFVMERGRLAIIGRQLDFKRGRIFFNGSLQPLLDMQASAEADGYTITISITGPASKPAFRFSSDPQLPEDEVIARLLFNKSLAKLSPVQLAQLAGEIDKIGGLSSGPSTLDRLKSAVGVDVLDVSTDEDNDPTVSAGSYVDENTYVGVRQGTSASSSRVVIDHDLTKTLKARGELGADGNSKIGIGVEWDY
jgi:translocation and assembly module TamB